MALNDTLRDAQTEVLGQAVDSLRRAHLPHYEESGPEVAQQRLRDLFALVIECLANRDLTQMCQYSERVADDRFTAGFGIAEVQTAFNVLEEAIWQVVVPRLPSEELAEDTGLVGTVLGAGKDALARKWVSLATSRHISTLDLSALFAGTRS